ncbi:MAG: hypothetical protein QF473_02250 [Planctomycetota bacterium]|jgi:hypothetical protein|nr:hypothetical protein [Planctomycetota bacterium]MDP6501989.1 hypothetical protein [Planctomycetota bacterium]
MTKYPMTKAGSAGVLVMAVVNFKASKNESDNKLSHSKGTTAYFGVLLLVGAFLFVCLHSPTVATTTPALPSSWVMTGWKMTKKIRSPNDEGWQ